MSKISTYQVELGSNTTDRLTKDIERLSEENEKLKSQIENEKQALQIDIDNLNQACLDLNQENDDLQRRNHDLTQMLETKEQECAKLKQELQEIKEDLNECNFDRNVAQLEANKYKQTIDSIGKLLEDSLDPEKTEVDESFENFYTILDNIKTLNSEKIMVNGIDVKECGQTKYCCDKEGKPTERVRCEREYKDRTYYCDEFDDCYFKQKERLKQENEILKNWLAILKGLLNMVIAKIFNSDDYREYTPVELFEKFSTRLDENIKAKET